MLVLELPLDELGRVLFCLPPCVLDFVGLGNVVSQAFQVKADLGVCVVLATEITPRGPIQNHLTAGSCFYIGLQGPLL